MAAVLAAAALAALTGCSRAGGNGPGVLTQNALLVDKDGNVSWNSVETYEGDNYSQDEMNAAAKAAVEAYNTSLGKTGSENEKGKERLLAFAQEIGDYNVPFTLLETGRAADSREALSSGEAAFEDTSGKEASFDKALSGENSILVKTEGSGLVRGEGKILYVTDGCSLRDAYTVQTAQDKASYIVFGE